MCILIVKQANMPLPSFEALYNCFVNNPDGCGYAVPGRTYHSMNFGDFYRHITAENPDLPMIIHFRWATHGSVKLKNCHPFHDRRTGVSFAHNGILDIKPIGDLTDSETAFKTRFVPAIIKDTGIIGPALREAVSGVIAHSKFAFLDARGNCHTFGSFINDGGVLYSNASYRIPRRHILWA